MYSIALAKAYICPDQRIVEPLAIYRGSTMIGFMQLCYRADSDDDYWVFHFFVDQLHQGQGYGRQALTALREQLRAHHPRCRGVRLTVHPQNHVAQQLYSSFGFRKTGEFVDGEIVYRLPLEVGGVEALEAGGVVLLPIARRLAGGIGRIDRLEQRLGIVEGAGAAGEAEGEK